MELLVNQALKLLATDSAEEAQPFGEAQLGAANALLDGVDFDENGVVDLISAEAGVRALPELARHLATLPLR